MVNWGHHLHGGFGEAEWLLSFVWETLGWPLSPYTTCLNHGIYTHVPTFPVQGAEESLEPFQHAVGRTPAEPCWPTPTYPPPRFLLSLKPQCLGVNSLPEIMLVLVHVFFIWKISDVVSQSDYSETSNSRLRMEDMKCLFKTKEVFLIL